MPQLPPMALTMMASLTSTLTAIAQIKLSLGIDPLAIGLPAVHLMVQERIQATISMVESLLGMSFSAALQFLAKLQLRSDADRNAAEHPVGCQSGAAADQLVDPRDGQSAGAQPRTADRCVHGAVEGRTEHEPGIVALHGRLRHEGAGISDARIVHLVSLTKND